jgi:hypothetical protein
MCNRESPESAADLNQIPLADPAEVGAPHLAVERQP